MKKKNILLGLLVALAVVLTACGGGSTPEATEAVPIVVNDFNVIAEGRVLPQKFVSLAFISGGQVDEILVEEGETVEEGAILARLGNRQQLESAVANAELELLNAQQALDDLYENVDLARAEALLAIAAARDAIRDSDRYINNLTVGSKQTDIDSAKADVVILKDKLDEVEEAHDVARAVAGVDIVVGVENDVFGPVDFAQPDQFDPAELIVDCVSRRGIG